MPKEKHLFAKISQSIILVRNERVLLLRHLSGKWILPGGRLHVKEKWIDGLLREIKEETGIDHVENIRVLGVDNWKEKGEYHYGVFIYGTTKIDEVSLGSEHDDFIWATKEDVSRYKFWNKELKDRVVHFVQSINLI